MSDMRYDAWLENAALYDPDVCEAHGCPLPCEECRKGVQDDQADWHRGDR